jgi:threonine synthase
MKTLAFEICEQLTSLTFQWPGFFPPSETPWQSPDWYFQSVSGGMGPLGVSKGFSELKKMSFIETVPKMGIVQVAGCAPMVNAWRDQKVTAVPVTSPQTMIATLATGDPGRTYTELYKRLLEGRGGSFTSVTDEEAYRAMHLLAKIEGISVEPAAAVTFAGLIQEVRKGTIRPEEVVVVNCTGHTLPIESHILGRVGDHQINTEEWIPDLGREEGLLAALNNISTTRYPRIVIIDDEPNVRRLIIRILRSQGNYTLYEAVDGRSAIELISREIPDLVILDLMMPDIDGFAVINAIHAQKETRDIPIIVMTAKDLTNQEKIRLKDQIQSLMRKGNFVSEELLAEVKSLVK